MMRQRGGEESERKIRERGDMKGNSKRRTRYCKMTGENCKQPHI